MLELEILKKTFKNIDKKYKDIIGFKLRDELKIALSLLEKEICNHGLENITPPIENIFECFKNIHEIKVILIGQDPFPRSGQATGYAFSVPKNQPIPPSTHNIYKCLMNNKLMGEKPTHGNLEKWASQGVLMLNSTLTTLIGRSSKHKFWNNYTDALIKEFDKSTYIYILLGDEAIEKRKFIVNPSSTVLTWGHPSSLYSVNNIEHPDNFKYCDCFTKANKILISKNKTPINWDPNYDVNINNTINDDVNVLKEHINELNESINDVQNELNESINDDSNLQANSNSQSQSNLQSNLQANSQLQIQLVDQLPVSFDVFYKMVSKDMMKSKDMVNSKDIIIHIFTDGAAKNNNVPEVCTAGWGYYIVGDLPISKWNNGNVVRTVEAHPSNQRGELNGIYNGLLEINKIVDMISDKVIVKDKYGNNANNINIKLISDSEYSLKIISEWYASWVSKGKLESKKNLDIISPMMDVVNQLRKKTIFGVKHVNSHIKEPIRGTYEWFLWFGNEVADKLASTGINKR